MSFPFVWHGREWCHHWKPEAEAQGEGVPFGLQKVLWGCSIRSVGHLKNFFCKCILALNLMQHVFDKRGAGGTNVWEDEKILHFNWSCLIFIGLDIKEGCKAQWFTTGGIHLITFSYKEKRKSSVLFVLFCCQELINPYLVLSVNIIIIIIIICQIVSILADPSSGRTLHLSHVTLSACPFPRILVAPRRRIQILLIFVLFVQTDII